MGLFGSKKKTYVGTSIVRAIDDKNLPDSVKSGLFQAIQMEGDIPAYVMDELLVNIGRRAERSYNYAKTSYPYGLPFSQTLEVTMGDDEASAVLSALEGQPVSIDYCNLAPANPLHFGWMKLLSQYGYNPATNEVEGWSFGKGFPVYLVDMVPALPAAEEATYEMDAIEQWGDPPTLGQTPTRQAMPSIGLKFSPPQFLPTVSQECLRVYVEWDEITIEIVNGVPKDKHTIKTEDFFVPLDATNDEGDYLHVKYMVGGVTKYWAYLVGSGTYPLLDGLINQPGQTFGEFFPYLYFRHAKTPIGADKNSDVYKAARKMSRILGMNYDEIHDAIHENPDIADVEQAVMMFAVPVNTEDPLEMRYLFDFLKKMYFTQEHQFQWGQSVPILGSILERDEAGRNGIIIKDSLFEFALRHDGIFKRNVAGSIGAVGTHTKAYREDNKVYTMSDGESSYEVHVPYPVHTFRRQISYSMYEEIEVRSLKTVFKVFEHYEVTGDEEDAILIIPIDRSITKAYSMREREILYSRGMHYVFNSRVVVKVKWYQTGLFRFILVVVAIVLIVFTYGQTLQALAAGLAAGGAAATIAIMAILKKILIGLVVQYAFKLFVQAVGLDAAFLIAVLAALAGAYQFLTQGGVANAPWVQELVQVSTGLSSAINSVASDLMNDLLGEYNSFLEEAERQMETLERAQDLLDQKSWLSPFVVFGESPSDFFNRTVHSGNIGALSVEAVTNYVQVALKLPELADTVGDSSYG